jgi:hypothetical protein
MIVDRREFLALSSALVAVLSAPPAFPAMLPKRLVFIHGRGQEGLDATKLKQDWISVLKTGATNAGLALPDSVEIAFPFYGDRLARPRRFFFFAAKSSEAKLSWPMACPL